MENQQKYLVAIKCITYNHKKYLADALEGFVMQKTNFPFVAIVHDDASTDGTAAILRQYAERYPDIIHPIYETENQYSKRDGSLGRIMNEAVDATGAKYVAMCEGDDYWIDPYKLQKQVDFLESHPDYLMCFHAAEIKNENGRHPIIQCENLKSREYFPNDVFPTWIVPCASMIYRPDLIADYPFVHADWLESGDTKLILQCMHRGRVWGMADRMSVYRVHEGSAMDKQIGIREQEKYVRHLKCFLLNFPKIDKQYCYYEIGSFDMERFHNNDGNNNRWYYLYDAWRWAAPYMWKRIYMNCKHTIKTAIKKLIHKS